MPQARQNPRSAADDDAHPEALTPKHYYGVESRVPWHVIGDALPRRATDQQSRYLEGAVSDQDPAGAD